jgi:hypothetical protein
LARDEDVDETWPATVDVGIAVVVVDAANEAVEVGGMAVKRKRWTRPLGMAACISC